MTKLALAFLLLLPAPALAGDFVDSVQPTRPCGGVSPRLCCYATIESDLMDITLDTRGTAIYIMFDMDINGATSGTTVDLYSCSDTSQAQANCDPLKWDTDGDGVVDNNRLDGNTDMKRGVQDVQVPTLLVDPIVHTQDARITVCGIY
jgi:hypothetical protein